MWDIYGISNCQSFLWNLCLSKETLPSMRRKNNILKLISSNPLNHNKSKGQVLFPFWQPNIVFNRAMTCWFCRAFVPINSFMKNHWMQSQNKLSQPNQHFSSLYPSLVPMQQVLPLWKKWRFFSIHDLQIHTVKLAQNSYVGNSVQFSGHWLHQIVLCLHPQCSKSTSHLPEGQVGIWCFVLISV